MTITRMGFLVLVSLSCLAATACTLARREPRPSATTPYGGVWMLDHPTRAHMRVLEQKAELSPAKHLVVSVRWLNRSKRPYKAEMRAAFFDAQGFPERAAYTWDLQPFPPGESTTEWTSYTRDAVRYRIEIRSAH